MASAISRSRGERRLLDAVALELSAGEVVALFGSSGSGKSTLLRALAGLDAASNVARPPRQGRESEEKLEVDGQTPAVLGWPVWRRKVNYLPQTPSLMNATVEENLRRASSYKSSKFAFPDKDARVWLTDLGLDQVWHRNARSLSVGEQQRVCLVRALSVYPRVLLLDEPTAALDPESTRMVRGWLTAWAEREQGAALVVTHEVADASSWSARQLRLEGGRLRPLEVAAVSSGSSAQHRDEAAHG